MQPMFVRLGLRSKEFHDGMKKAQNDLRLMRRDTQRLSNTFRSFKSIAAASFVGWGIKRVISDTIRLANEQEKATAKLNAIMKSTGNIAGFTTKQLQDYASALQSITIYGNETVETGMAILATFTNVRGEVFEKTIKAALDLSALLGQDLRTSVLALGKALNDPVANLGALSRSGIQFSKTQKALIKDLIQQNKLLDAQNIILKEMERQFGGTSEAIRDTFGGAATAAKNAFGDLLEEIGFIITKSESMVGLMKDLEDTAIKISNVIKSLREGDKDLGLEGFNNQIEEIDKKIKNLKDSMKVESGFLMKIFDPIVNKSIEKDIERLEEQKRILIEQRDQYKEIGMVVQKISDIPPPKLPEKANLVDIEKLTRDIDKATEKWFKDLDELDDKYAEIAFNAKQSLKDIKADMAIEEWFGDIDDLDNKVDEALTLWFDGIDRIEDKYIDTYASIEKGIDRAFQSIIHGQKDAWKELFIYIVEDFVKMLAKMELEAKTKDISVDVSTTTTSSGTGGGTSTGGAGGTSMNYGALAQLIMNWDTLSEQMQEENSILENALSGAVAGYAVGGGYGALFGALGGIAIGGWTGGSGADLPPSPEKIYISGEHTPTPSTEVNIPNMWMEGIPGPISLGNINQSAAGQNLYQALLEGQYLPEYAVGGTQQAQAFANQLVGIQNQVIGDFQDLLNMVPDTLGDSLLASIEEMGFPQAPDWWDDSYGDWKPIFPDWDPFPEGIPSQFPGSLQDAAAAYTDGLNNAMTEAIGEQIQNYVESTEAYSLLGDYAQQQLMSTVYTEGGESPFGSIEEMVEALEYLEMVNKAWRDISLTAQGLTGESIAYQQGINQINDAFDEMIDTLQELGVSTEQITEIEEQREEALRHYAQEMQQQRRDILDQWLIISGSLTEEERQLMELEKRYQASREALIDRGATQEELDQLESLYDRSVANVIDQIINQNLEVINQNVEGLKNSWSDFYNTMMGDLAPTQSVEYMGLRLTQMMASGSTEELMNFITSEYLPYMKQYGESDYNQLWSSIMNLMENMTNTAIELESISAETIQSDTQEQLEQISDKYFGPKLSYDNFGFRPSYGGEYYIDVNNEQAMDEIPIYRESGLYRESGSNIPSKIIIQIGNKVIGDIVIDDLKNNDTDLIKEIRRVARV